MQDNDWIEFKKKFTQEQEDALWQYFMDHSRIQPNGYFGIMFYIKDVNDFWKRLHSRHTGDFSRYNAEEKKRNQSLAIARYMKYKYKIEKTKLNRVLFWLYKKIYHQLFKI